jgi:sporulation protein YlmC with PRC-barrel domain
MKEARKKSVAMYGVAPASKIIGETVVNRQNEKVGKIHELVIDARNSNFAAWAVPGRSERRGTIRRAIMPSRSQRTI